ncbi:glycosyltransferase [Catalinimonas sp. 4WD22]|uniref:glycosyltransferase n=1 Tax=Catalinimonas locisalis TaxID=3133978 RepID=UPI003101A477
MKVTLLSGSNSRKSGGLYNSVRCLTNSLNQKQVNACILAHNDEFSSEDIKAYSNPTASYKLVGPTNFGYSTDLHRILRQQKPDIIHTQCLWMYLSKVSLDIYKKHHVPHIISPRGMLDPWAVSNAAWKKKIVATWFENNHLKTSACIHALCQAEANAIREYGLKNPIAIIPNGIDLPPSELTQLNTTPAWKKDIPEDKKVLLFLGRIHPKKGLKFLIEAWASFEEGVKDWCLVIAGWDESGHRSELEAIVKKNQLEKHILFVGSQLRENKTASYLHADAFILPSLSEGLPMSVLEAWSYKLPVLMTPQCNLPEGFHANAAKQFAPDVGGNYLALCWLQKQDVTQLKLLGENGYKLVKEKFTWERIAEQMADVYKWVLTGEHKPLSLIAD